MAKTASGRTVQSRDEWRKSQSSGSSTAASHNSTSAVTSSGRKVRSRSEWRASASQRGEYTQGGRKQDPFGSFLTEANKFFQGAEKEINNSKGFDAAEFFESRKRQGDILKNWAADLSSFIDNHADSYTPEYYDYTKSILAAFDTDVDDVLSYYQPAVNAKAGMQAYDDEYRAYQERQKSSIMPAAIQAGMMPEITNPAYGFLNMQNQYRADTSHLAVTDSWTDDERYQLGLLQQEDPAKARDFARQVNDYHNAEATAAQRQAVRDAATQSFGAGALHTAGALGTSTLMGMPEFLDRMAEYTARGTTTEKAGMMPSDYSNEVVGGISENLNQRYGTIREGVPILGGRGVGDLYNLGYSIGQNLLSRYTLGAVGGQPLVLASYFANAANSGIDEARRRGASGDQAMAKGLITGALEVATEFVPTSRLFKMGPAVTVGQLLKEVGMESLDEFVGEGLNAALGYGADMLIMDDMSEYETSKRNYMEQGMTEEEAHAQTLKDAVSDIIYEGLSGAVSGALSAGAETAYKTGTANRYYRNVNPQSLIDEGMNTNADSKAYQLAEQMQQKVDSNQDISGNQKRILAQNTQIQQQAEAMTAAETAAADDLTAMGETGDVKKLANIVARKSMGEKLTRADQRAIRGSENVQTLLDAMAETGEESAVESAEPLEVHTEEVPGKVSKDGRAIQISTDSAIDTLDFASMDNGKATIQLKDGGTADYDDVVFATQGDANRFYAVKSLPGMDTESANNLFHTIEDAKAGEDLDSVAGIREAYGLGYYGFQQSDLAKGEDSSRLTPELSKAIFDIGRQQRNAAVTVPVKAQATTKPTKGYKKVVIEGKVNTRNPKTKAEIAFADYIAENFSGAAVHVYESFKGRDGKRYYRDNNGKVQRAPNGMYVKDEIWVDTKAGNRGEGLMLNTFAHEMYHHIEKWNKPKAQELAEFIVRELGMESVEKAIAEQIKKARKAGVGESYFVKEFGMTEEQAANEVYSRAMSDFMADSLETMFTKGNVAESIARLRSEIRAVFDKIKEFVDTWVSKLKEFYNGKTISEEGAAVAKLESFEKIQQMFMEAMKGAGENYQAAEVTNKIDTILEGDVKYQARSTGYDYATSFAKQVDDWINGIFPARDTLVVGGTPDVLRKVGFPSLPITIAQVNLKANINGQYKGTQSEILDHVVKSADFKKLPELLADPVAIIADRRLKNNKWTVSEHIVDVLVEMEINGKQTLVPIKIDGKGMQNGTTIDALSISSVHGNKDALDRLNYALQNDSTDQILAYYVNKNKASAVLRKAGYTITGWPNTNDGFIHSITEPGSPVNLRISNQTDSRQFKNWFGNSKIVNSDGKPKVMYHGSPAQFSRFDRKKAKSSGLYGRGFYFTDSDTHAKTYGNTYSVYLNIRNPLQSGSTTVSREQARKFLEAVAENEDYSIENYGTYEIDSILKTVLDGKSKGDAFKIIQDISATAIGDMVEAAELFNTVNGTEFDGIVVPTETVAFRPEQIKSATDNIGTFDPQNDDIRYSLRDDILDGATKEAVIRSLEKQNAKLRGDVGYLKELLKIQSTVTDGTKFTKRSVENMASILMKNNNAKGDKRELGAMLTHVYEYIAKNEDITWDGIAEKAQPAVEWIKDHVQEHKQINEYANDILREIRTSRVSLDESQKKEAAHLYGSFNNFRKSLMGQITIVKDDGISLDSRWQELAEMYPGMFDSDVSSSDMPGLLASIIDSLRDMRYESIYGSELDDADILRQVYDGYWRVSTLKTVADKKQKEINKLKYNHTKRMQELSDEYNSDIAALKKKAREDVAKAKQRGATALQEYRLEQRAAVKAMQDEQRILREELTGKESDITIMEKEFIRLAKEHEAERVKSETLTKKLKQAAAQKADSKIWEKEFGRLLKEYDAAGRKIDRLEQTILRQRATAKARVEGRRNTEMRHKIQRKADNLNRLLLQGGKDRNIPIGLQKPVAEILDAINMEVRDAEQRERNYESVIARYDRQIAMATDPLVVEALTEKRDRYAAKGDQFANKMGNLKKAYDDIRNDPDPLIQNAYDEVLSDYLDTLVEKIGDTPLGQMNRDQLEAVNEILTAVQERVRSANEAFAEGKKKRISEMGAAAIRQVRTVGGERNKGKVTANVIAGINNFGWNNMRPIDALEAIGSDELTEDYKNLRKGEDTWARDMGEAKEFFQNQWKKHHADKWDLNREFTFTSASDQKFKLTLEQIMSIYAHFRREQSREHLRKGGFVFDSSLESTVKVGPVKIPVKGKTADATAYNLSDEVLGEIIGKLTPEQAAFVEEMQSYLSDTMGAKGNEVSLKMYGIKLFKEKVYFPLRSASQFMERAKAQQTGDVKMKNAGFTKAVKPNANNPVVLTPFLTVWAEHVDQMSNYHAFVLPLEDFYRVYNFKADMTSEQLATQSVQAAIQNAYGEGAVKYIDQLLKDINGGVRADSTVGSMNSWISRYKKGATLASASVFIQQPSAILRATAMVDPKYFLGRKVDAKYHDRTWDEIKKWAPIASIKEIGGFDTNMGKTAVDYLTGQEYQGFEEKFKAFFKDGEFRDEMLGRLPALADELSWGVMWNAIKREQADLHPNMNVKSDGFMKLVADRFTDVVVHTQVYDSVFSRSAMMRSKDTGMKMATAFMAEPTVTANMLANAIIRGKRTGSRVPAARTIASIVAAQTLNAMLVSFVYAMRDDDEEERYDEKWIASFRENLLSSLNPMGYIPFLRDVQSIFQGYDVERADMSVISDFADAFKSLSDEEMGAWEKVEKFTGALFQIFGVPAKNVMRDVRGLWNTFRIAFNVDNDATSTGYYMALTGKDLNDGEQLLLAIQRDDQEHIERVASRFESQQKAESALQSAIREEYLSGKITAEEAEELLTTNFDRDSEHDVYWIMDSWDYAKANGNAEGYAKFNNLRAAIDSGEGYEAEIDRHLQHGAEPSDVRSQISKAYRKQYLTATADEQAEIREKLLPVYEYTGLDEQEVMDKFNDWDFESRYGMTYSQYKAEYREGNVTESQLREAMDSYGLMNFEIEETVRDLNEEIAFHDRYGMSMTDMKDAYDKGEVSRSTLISALVYSGKTETEARKEVTQRDIENRLGIDYAKLDDAYKHGDISRQELYNAIKENGATTEEASEAIICYDWLKKNIKKHPDLAISDARRFVVRVSDKMEERTLTDFGVSIDIYKQYVVKAKDCPGVDADGDGNIDSYSRAKQLFAMIDKLPITSEAKDGLAYITNAKSTIKKYAPWR